MGWRIGYASSSNRPLRQASFSPAVERLFHKLMEEFMEEYERMAEEKRSEQVEGEEVDYASLSKRPYASAARKSPTIE